MKNLESFDPKLARDETSSDPQGTKLAMEKALADDCNLKAAVCLLLKADYDILSSHFDYKCTGCNDTITHSTAS